MRIECKELNWLCQHMKKFISSQASISINSCTNWGVKQSFSVWISLQRSLLRKRLFHSTLYNQWIKWAMAIWLWIVIEPQEKTDTLSMSVAGVELLEQLTDK